MDQVQLQEKRYVQVSFQQSAVDEILRVVTKQSRVLGVHGAAGGMWNAALEVSGEVSEAIRQNELILSVKDVNPSAQKNAATAQPWGKEILQSEREMKVESVIRPKQVGRDSNVKGTVLDPNPTLLLTALGEPVDTPLKAVSRTKGRYGGGLTVITYPPVERSAVREITGNEPPDFRIFTRDAKTDEVVVKERRNLGREQVQDLRGISKTVKISRSVYANRM